MRNEQEKKTPKNGPMMGPPPAEKAKNFKEAIKRLFSELKGFKVLIIIALTLAILGSVLSIVAPDKLSELTDEISEGLVVDTENLQTITETIQVNFAQGKQEEFENDLAECLDYKVLNGWSTEA